MRLLDWLFLLVGLAATAASGWLAREIVAIYNQLP